jgi:hypothetical protein
VLADARFVNSCPLNMVASPKALLLTSLVVATSVNAHISGNASSPQHFEELERHGTYGRSPPIYPSRELLQVILER